MVDIDRVRKEHVDRNLLAGIDAAPIEDVRRIQLLPQFEQRAIGAGVGLADREELFGAALGGEAIIVILAVEALLVFVGQFQLDRKRVVLGKSVSVRVERGGRRILKKKTK